MTKMLTLKLSDNKLKLSLTYKQTESESDFNAECVLSLDLFTTYYYELLEKIVEQACESLWQTKDIRVRKENVPLAEIYDAFSKLYVDKGLDGIEISIKF